MTSVPVALWGRCDVALDGESSDAPVPVVFQFSIQHSGRSTPLTRSPSASELSPRSASAKGDGGPAEAPSEGGSGGEVLLRASQVSLDLPPNIESMLSLPAPWAAM